MLKSIIVKIKYEWFQKSKQKKINLDYEYVLLLH